MKQHHAALALGLVFFCTPAAAFLLPSTQPRLAVLPTPAGTPIRRCAGSSLSPVFAQIKGKTSIMCSIWTRKKTTH